MIDNLLSSLNLIIAQTQANYPVLIAITALLLSVFVLNALTQNKLLWLGIIPRRLYGLFGIFFAPLLHANFNHLFFNLIPLLVLSNFILIEGMPLFLWVTLVITLMSGFLIWCFGTQGIHLGSSALITGYWGFLVCNILKQGTLTAILLGIISLYYFAGIFLGIFPGKKGVSWEGHLFGLIAGIATSYLISPHI